MKAAPDLVDELFDDQGLKLPQWLRTEQARIVKDGLHRTVYRVQLRGGRFYLKHHKPTRFPRRLQNLFRPCRALLEWTAARRIAGLGLPTIEPVAVGYSRRGYIVADSYLMTRDIPNSVPMDEFVLARQSNGSMTSAMRRSIAVELGDLIARLHAGRIIHSDLHAGNVMIRIGAQGRVRLSLIDLHPVGQRSRLSISDIEHNLSLLNNFFGDMASPSDRRRFLRSYMQTIDSVSSTTRLAGVSSHRSSMRALSRRIDDYCASAVQECHRKNDRKWITGNRRLIIADSSNRRCRGVATLGAAKVAQLRDDPESMFAANTIVQWRDQSPSCRSAIVDIFSSKRCCGTAIQTAKPNRTQRLMGEFSSARRAWEGGHALLRRSIRCPQPLLFVEFTSDRGMCQQYLLTESVADTRRLSELVAAGGCENTLRQCLDRLASELRRMFSTGIEHQSLDAENILVAMTDGECEISFWGLEGIRIRRRISRAQTVASLARLNAGVPARSIVRLSHRLRFLRRLLQDRFCGSLSKDTWKNAWREIANESRLLSASANRSPLAFPYC